jgi:small conductance mechanosensitive channel
MNTRLPSPARIEDSFAEQAAVARKLADVLGDLAINLVIAAVILAVTLWAAGWVSGLVSRALQRFSRTREDRTLQSFGSSVARWAVIIIGLIAVLTRLGVETTSIIAVVGAASLAIGLAMQGTLGNVAAGVMLLVLRPYQVGDFVEIAGRQGEVKGLKLFTTEIDTPDNVRITAPNGKVFGELITNFTAHGERRVDVLVSVDVEDDLARAMEVLRTVADSDPRVRKTPEPLVEVTDIADGRARLALRAWADRHDYAAVKSAFLIDTQKALGAAGIHPAYPRQVTYVRESSAEH